MGVASVTDLMEGYARQEENDCRLAWASRCIALLAAADMVHLTLSPPVVTTFRTNAVLFAWSYRGSSPVSCLYWIAPFHKPTSWPKSSLH